MKKIILLFFFLAGTASLHAQDYVPLIDTTRTWNWVDFGPGAVTQVYFFGDTISIDDTLYVEIKAKFPDKSYRLHGYMREDTSARKVYYRFSMWSDQSYLLYDFTLEEGDTIQLYGDLRKYTVHQVDTVELLNGDIRKRWNLSLVGATCEAVWIEGIGNITAHLLIPGESDASPSGSTTLCVHENEELVYINEEYNTCILDWVNVTETNSETITIYPNPAKDHITISGEPGNELEVHMYDMQGRLILKQQIGNHETINVSHLDPGLIFLRVIDKKTNVTSFKFIKL